MDFLQFNQTAELKLYGGCLEKIKIETLHLGEHTKSLILIDMPSIDMPSIFEYMPQLKHLHIQNCDEFKKENFIAMQRRLIAYKGLETFGLELLSFDIEDVKSEYLDILRIHSDSLRRLSLARNKVSNQFLKDICSVLAGSLPSLEYFDLRHLKETGKIDWID